MPGKRLPGNTLAEKLALNSYREGPCLRWSGAHTPAGYGQLHHAGKHRPVHRLAFEVAIGPIPDGLVIDHVVKRGCRFHDCIEPSHLEAVTQRENVLRGASVPPPPPPIKATCLRGHIRTRPAISCRSCLAELVDCPECGRRVRRQNLPRHIRRIHGGNDG